MVWISSSGIGPREQMRDEGRSRAYGERGRDPLSQPPRCPASDLAHPLRHRVDAKPNWAVLSLVRQVDTHAGPSDHTGAPLVDVEHGGAAFVFNIEPA